MEVYKGKEKMKEGYKAVVYGNTKMPVEKNSTGKSHIREDYNE